MANNRLYILDPETGERICIAKNMGDGWHCFPGEGGLEARLNKWFEGPRDTGAWDIHEKTQLVLITEADT